MNATPADPLDRVLSELPSADSLRVSERTAYDTVADGARQAVIAGAGQLGRAVLAGVRRAGFDIVAFADNDQSRWGRAIDGVPVMSPADAVLHYNATALFLVAIYNSTASRVQLQQLGCRRVMPYPLFFWRFAAELPWETRLELPHRIVEHSGLMRDGYAHVTDERSKREFAAQIAWRCTLDYARLPAPDPPSAMYFPADVMKIGERESLADCGAFDGDSIRMFLDRTGGRFDRIHACEPDVKNLAALHSFLQTLSPADRARVSVFPFGVSDVNGTVAFDGSGTVASRMATDGGTSVIECRRLDDLLDGQPVTIIKMDIEGAEPLALRGATRTIRRARPILAVCAYHECRHLWTLPPMIHDALPEYRILLRRYAEECWETVYYAIPPERVRA